MDFLDFMRQDAKINVSNFVFYISAFFLVLALAGLLAFSFLVGVLQGYGISCEDCEDCAYFDPFEYEGVEPFTFCEGPNCLNNSVTFSAP